MKNKLTVCCGTSCYLITGNRTEKLRQLVQEAFGDKVDVVPSACLGQCVKKTGSPPFAKYNNEIIPNATNENIIQELKKRLN